MVWSLLVSQGLQQLGPELKENLKRLTLLRSGLKIPPKYQWTNGEFKILDSTHNFFTSFAFNDYICSLFINLWDGGSQKSVKCWQHSSGTATRIRYMIIRDQNRADDNLSFRQDSSPLSPWQQTQLNQLDFGEGLDCAAELVPPENSDWSSLKSKLRGV